MEMNIKGFCLINVLCDDHMIYFFFSMKMEYSSLRKKVELRVQENKIENGSTAQG